MKSATFGASACHWLFKFKSKGYEVFLALMQPVVQHLSSPLPPPRRFSTGKIGSLTNG